MVWMPLNMKTFPTFLLKSYKTALALLCEGMLAWQTFDGLV